MWVKKRVLGGGGGGQRHRRRRRGDGNLVEVTPGGAQVAHPTVTSGGAGALFGLAIAPHGSGVYFVDDSVNKLDLLH